MFNQIAPTYDLANRVISMGVDISWRKSACKIVLENFKSSNVKIADVACGTGDMMGIWSDMAGEFDTKIDKITGIDPSVGMLEVAKKKFPNFGFITASATDTTLESDSQNILSISYGIRNVVERTKALREFNRVLQNRGYLVVLEFTKPCNSGVISKIRNFYITKILPLIGGFISKNREAYEYLPSSIENFLDTQSFKDELRDAGFEMVHVEGFSFEVSTLFIAQKVTNV